MPRGVYERTTKPVEERFWAKVNKGGPLILESRCWIWTGGKSEGYGRIMVRSENGRGVMEFAHRLSYLWAHGELPPEDCRHRCHVRACVNPAHLRPGTRAENMQDMIDAGRSLVGERQPNHKLTWERVRDARRRHARGVSTSQLARDCGVSERTMRQCLSGETWIESGER